MSHIKVCHLNVPASNECLNYCCCSWQVKYAFGVPINASQHKNRKKRVVGSNATLITYQGNANQVMTTF